MTSLPYFLSTNYGTVISLKAKTSRLITAPLLRISICFRNMRRSWSEPNPMSSMLVGAIRAVQQVTKSIPIVGIADDIVGEGLVGSFARPNGNVTGISILATELDGKRQDILIEAVPGIRRMAALADSSTLTEAKARALQEAARAHKVELSIYRITRAEEIDSDYR